jgi:long-chain acyl-CoA synthetase
MLEILSNLQRNAALHDGVKMFSDDEQSLTREGVSARVAASARALESVPQRIGLLAGNGVEYAVGQLAAWVAGKTVVPLPLFFSSEQLSHIIRDAGLTHALITTATDGLAIKLGIAPISISTARSEIFPEPSANGGQIIYTSGSTGRPKGVRLTLGQLNESARLLAAATNASSDDLYLSILPLPLLLETISAICVPIIAGARTRFDSLAAANVAKGRSESIYETFARHRPTTSVLVPELLSAWVGDLARRREAAPLSLRFVAVGGAPISPTIANKAWSAGIPVHEGYGLSECCSVVSLNRPGDRKPGTVGKPLAGLDVRVDEGEIVVRGPTIMRGYLNGTDISREWQTGDLGAFDQDGFLTIYGRKDNLLVTSYGRNVSPEWIESMLLADSRFAACGLVGHGESHLSAVIIPTPSGAKWLSASSQAQVLHEIAHLCREAPDFAVPKDFAVISKEDAVRLGLFTPNGRIKRASLPSVFRTLKAEVTAMKFPSHEKAGVDRMNFYDELQEKTSTERSAFLSIPLIRDAVVNGASRELYIDFLTQAYHHVKHTFPELALAASLTKDEAFQDALVEYMEEERGHEKWILNDIVAFGGNAEAVAAGMPSEACQILVGYTYYAIQWISPYALLGSVHVLEGMSTMLADKAADAIQKTIGDTKKDGFSYLRSHGALDIEHVAFFKELVNKITDPAVQNLIVDTSRIIYRLYGDIFRELAVRHPGRRNAA